ncbi:MAG: BON domain-containing protein [Planctomycetes bacterium]|nr:BON domain-containing protein [Planctomycetota bacterium]
MSQHQMNTPHTSRKRLPFAIPLAFTTALGIGIATRFAPAATPSADHAREPFAESESQPATLISAETPRVVISDVVLARTALTALDADPDLRGVNVVVSIVDRVAVIGGPVSGQRQSKRVEEIVRSIPGIVEVRNTCFVSAGPDPLLNTVADKMVSSLPPRPAMYDLPGVLTGTVGPSAPNAGTGASSSLMASADPASTVVVRKPTAESGVLGGPVSPATPSPIVVGSSPVPGTLTANRADVLAMADNVRKTDARFTRLTVEIRAGMLVISGSAPLAADAWDYAEKLRGVPGVSRVVVGTVSGK